MKDSQTGRRQRAERKGRGAEILVIWRYRLCGWRLVAHRYRCPQGEIDLIMRRGGRLVFIEVKFAAPERGTPERAPLKRILGQNRLDSEALAAILPPPWQQARIRTAAEVFLARHSHAAPHAAYESRIDIVIVQSFFRMICFTDVMRE